MTDNERHRSQLLELVRLLEWMPRDDTARRCCLYCCEAEGVPHAANCLIWRLLKGPLPEGEQVERPEHWVTR